MIKSRNRTADLLKGVAVILMVQVHLIELFAQQNIYDSSLGSVLLFLGGPPAAPVFMAVMGFFIASGNTSFSKSMQRGVKLLFGGLLLNLGLNFHLFIKIYNNTIITSPWPYLFGVDILFLAGFSIIIIAFLKKIKVLNPTSIMIIIALIFSIIAFVPYPEINNNLSYISALFYDNIWWSYFPVIPWLVYPLTGYLFYKTIPKVKKYIITKKYLLIIMAVTGLILLFTIGYGISVAANLHQYYHHNYLYYLFVVNFIIFWSALFHYFALFPSNFITTFAEWLGKNVTVFYVMQWLLIGNIGTALYKTQNLYKLAFWFIGIMLLASLLTMAYIEAKKYYKRINS